VDDGVVVVFSRAFEGEEKRRRDERKGPGRFGWFLVLEQIKVKRRSKARGAKSINVMSRGMYITRCHSSFR